MKRIRSQLNKCLRAALALSLALTFLFGGAVFGGAVDLSRACSITVSLGSGEFSDALREADLVVDLYRVAGTTMRSGEDDFDFVTAASYTTLNLSAAQTQEDWAALAYEASALARESDTPLTANVPVETAIGGESGLTTGLYLLLVHGRGETALGEHGETLAYDGVYRYLFAPQLISLPSRETNEDDAVDAVASDGWTYDMTVYPKPEREQVYGSLRIVKTLRGYDPQNAAVFVFSIEAMQNETLVYSDVRTMSFSAEGTQTLDVDRLPVGAEVTVTEVNSGAGYVLRSPASVTVSVDAEQINEAAFINQYVGSPNRVRGIDNHFTFDQNEGWHCTQTPAPSE